MLTELMINKINLNHRTLINDTNKKKKSKVGIKIYSLVIVIIFDCW